MNRAQWSQIYGDGLNHGRWRVKLRMEQEGVPEGIQKAVLNAFDYASGDTVMLPSFVTNEPRGTPITFEDMEWNQWTIRRHGSTPNTWVCAYRGLVRFLIEAEDLRVAKIRVVMLADELRALGPKPVITMKEQQ